MTALVLVLSILLKLCDGHPVPQQAAANGQLTATPAGALSQMLVNLLNYKLQWLSQFTGAIPGAAAPGVPCPPLFGAGSTAAPAEEPPADEEEPADEEAPADEEPPAEEEPAPEDGETTTAAPDETTTAAPAENGLDAL